ncbi:MAG: hypothetical protein GYA21_00175 [Myxococcales bacterium]|nr:hypothetical protein [Myxococcales bacterium]
MGKFSYKKYGPEDQRLLATWAAACAERVLPFFEQAYPKDGRPREAIAACRSWVRTGVFKMAEVRRVALAAHAAARDAKENEAACFAARAAGHALGTAHVPQHAAGSAYYALKAVAAADPANAGAKTAKEFEWQWRHLAKHLRRGIMDRITILKMGGRVLVRLCKAPGF